MLHNILIILVTIVACNSYAINSNRYHSNRLSPLFSNNLEKAPFNDIIPFLSEHIQPSDQLLFIGAQTDMAIELLRNDYGTKMTGFMTIVDSDSSNIEALRQVIDSDEKLSLLVNENKIRLHTADLTNMPEICKQSTFDAIVDYGGLDSLLLSSDGEKKMLLCIDHLQNAVRLGNILVCLSKLDKEQFCKPFEERFVLSLLGWVQELDGEPGEISSWYRGKTNIEATASNFSKLGLKMYVYTNTDNC